MGKLLRGALVAGLAVVLFWPAGLTVARADHDGEGHGRHRGWYCNRGHHYGWAHKRYYDDYDEDYGRSCRTYARYERRYVRYRRPCYVVRRVPRYYVSAYGGRPYCGGGWSVSLYVR